MNIFKARVLIMPAKDRLFELLESLEAKELEYLLKKILEVDSEEFKKTDKVSKSDAMNTASKYIRDSAGNFLANIFRDDHDIAYRKIIYVLASDMNSIFKDNIKIDSYSDEELEYFFLASFSLLYSQQWNNLSLDEKENMFIDSIEYYNFTMRISEKEIFFLKNYYPAMIYLLVLNNIKKEKELLKQRGFKW